jgi:hypothetical protein
VRDPFAHVKKMYMSDRRDGEYFVSEVTDADRRKYEGVPVPGVLPRAAEGRPARRGGGAEDARRAVQGPRAGVRVRLRGKAECREVWVEYLEGPVRGGGERTGPFGVAAVTARDVLSIEEYGAKALRGARLIQSWTMELAETSTGAKSALPDKN